jgi:hypothetical protein
MVRSSISNTLNAVNRAGTASATSSDYSIAGMALDISVRVIISTPSLISPYGVYSYEKRVFIAIASYQVIVSMSKQENRDSENFSPQSFDRLWPGVRR